MAYSPKPPAHIPLSNNAGFAVPVRNCQVRVMVTEAQSNTLKIHRLQQARSGAIVAYSPLGKRTLLRDLLNTPHLPADALDYRLP